MQSKSSSMLILYVHILRNQVMGWGVKAHLMTIIVPSGRRHQHDSVLHEYFTTHIFQSCSGAAMGHLILKKLFDLYFP